MRLRRTLVVGFVVGSVAGLGAVAVSAETDDLADMPADKRAAVTNRGPQVDSLPNGEGGVARRIPASDSGAPGDVATVKQAVTDMLTLELQAAAMPRSVEQRRGSADARRRQAAATAGEIWVSEVAASRRSELLRAIDAVTDDSTYLSYTDARFAVTEWQGVTVDGDQATATVLGHNQFHAPGEAWTNGRESQVQIQLARTGHGPSGWQFVTKSVLFDEEN